jgi:predicted acetyltransferase
MAARQFMVIEHHPYSPDLAPANFFLFPKVKRELVGLTLTKETFKKEW